MGLSRSAVLSTLPSPTCVLVTPDTVPVNVGLAVGAFDARLVATVLAKTASLFNASESSFNVSRAAGAESIRLANLA